MKQIKWFDRKFEFSGNQNIFPSIIERLKGTPIRLIDKISNVKKIIKSTEKYDNQWSISENIGHLIDLEPLWQRRLDEIINAREVLCSADLENKETDLANHNTRNIQDLLNEFSEIRNITIAKLENLSEKDIYKSALHPRLKTPMRIMDLFLFVAEHDDHHLAKINELKKNS